MSDLQPKIHLRAWYFLQRWQEWAFWLPLTVVMFYLAWAIFGAMDKTARQDQVPLVILLCTKILYALSALALTYQARRRWRFKLTALQQLNLWNDLMAGGKGAMVVYVTDALFTLLLLYWLLKFFHLSS